MKNIGHDITEMMEMTPDWNKSQLLESISHSRSTWIEIEEDKKLFRDKGKPGTIDELVNRLRIEEKPPKCKTSLLYANYDDPMVYYLPERVGIDICSLDVVIEKCDGVTFEECINQYTDSGQYPMISTTMVSEAHQEAYVPIPGWDHRKYQKIEIILSPYFRAIFQYVHATDQLTGVRRSDSYKVETRVVPPKDNEILGNINNYTFEEEIDAIIEGLDQLEELGIYIAREKTRIHTLELNMTFEMDCDFSNLKRLLQYFQQYIDARYVNSIYVYNGKKRKEYSWDDPEEKYAKMKISGIQSKSKKISVKLYDKAFETIYDTRFNKKTGHKLSFEKYVRLPHKSLVRLEFRLSGKTALTQYLGEIYLGCISQDTLVSCFQKLVDRFFIKSYDKYSDESIKKLKEIFVRMADEHIVHKGFNWKAWLLQEIRAEEIASGSTPMCLESEDVEALMSLVPTFAHDRNRYRRELFSLLDTSLVFKNNYIYSYDVLADFFRKVRYQEGLSDARRIGYAVDITFDGLESAMKADLDYSDILRDYYSKESVEEHWGNRRCFDKFMKHLDDRKMLKLLRFIEDMDSILDEYGDGTDTTIREDKEFMRLYITMSRFIEYLCEKLEEIGDELIERYPALVDMAYSLDELRTRMEAIYNNIFVDE